MFTRSFVQAASPMRSPSLSYFVMILFNSSICFAIGSVAVLYSELISISSHLSFLRTLVIESGRTSSGTSEPTTLSRPRTYFTPSTFSSSFVIFLASFAESEESTRTICVVPTPNSSLSFVLAITFAISSGRLSDKS